MTDVSPAKQGTPAEAMAQPPRLPLGWIVPVVLFAGVLWWANRNRGFERTVGNGQNAIASEDWQRARE